MGIQFPNEGERVWLDRMLAVLNDCQIVLWTDDIAVDDDTVLANLTQPTGSWYIPIVVGMSPLFSAAVTEAGVTSATAAYVLRWDYSGVDASESIYGWAMLTPDVSTVMLVERFASAPITMGTSGDYIQLLPKLTLRDEEDI